MENIDLETAKNLGISLINSPEGNRDSVAEHVVAMLLILMNRLFIASEEVKNGIWKREENRGDELLGKTFGIIGYGNMGKATAKRLSGFGVEDFLGFTNLHKAYLFGVGSLGGALLRDSGLSHFGLQIVGAFDINPNLVGTTVEGIPIYHTDEFEERRAKDGVKIGVLTVPINIAQDITDKMVAGGIQAVWNFTPFRIRVPETIVVQNTSLYAHLAVMFNRLNEIIKK
jgi:NADH/NAD ratio-sensing transcriptional regulator Rex